MRARWVPITILSLSIVFASTLMGGENVPKEVQTQLKVIYDEIDQLFLACSEAYREAHSAPISLGFDVMSQGFEPKKYSVLGRLSIQVWAHNLEFEGAYNYSLAKSLDVSPSRKKERPALTEEEAVIRAKDYLLKSKTEIPVNVALTTVEFDKNYSLSWEVRWTRHINGYAWDEFNPAELESIHVIFHEKLGLIGVGNNIFSPQPKSFDVKLTREQTVAKALNYVPLIQRTPYYRQGPPGWIRGQRGEVLRIKSGHPQLAAGSQKSSLDS